MLKTFLIALSIVFMLLALNVQTGSQQQGGEGIITVRSVPVLSFERDWLDYAGIGLTALLIVLAIWQLILLHRSVDAARDAVLAAADNARAAKLSAEMAEAEVKVINRPYVILDSFRVDQYGVDREPIFYLNFTNSGRTAARNVQIDYKVFAAAPKGVTNPPESGFPFFPQKVPIIAPNGKFKSVTRWGQPLPAGHWEAIEGGMMTLAVNGNVQYQDEFGQDYGPYNFVTNYVPWKGPRLPDAEVTYHVEQ